MTYANLVSFAESQGVGVYLSEYAKTAYNPSSKIIYINPEKWVTEEERFIMLLHELGHHLNGIDWLKDIYKDESDAWDTGEKLCLKLYGKLPDDFYRVKDECLSTYLVVKGQTRASLYPKAYELEIEVNKLLQQMEVIDKKINKFRVEEEEEKPNWLLIGICSLVFIIGIPIIPHLPNQPVVTQQVK
jgi:hypothetical protein